MEAAVFKYNRFLILISALHLFPEHMKCKKYAWIIHPDLSSHTDTHIHTHPNTNLDPRVSQEFLMSLAYKKRERKTNTVAYDCRGKELNVQR